MRATQAGFTLIEVLIATALFAALAFGAFEAVRQLAAASRHLAARRPAYASLERLSAQLRAEARSATAIWAGSPDAGGASNGCVELDFFTADAAGPAFWSYRSFPHHAAGDAVPPDALERLAARAPLAPCDATLTGSIVLTGLRATPALVTTRPEQLAAHRDAYLASADSPFVAASVPATPPVALGVLDAAGAPVLGGNSVVELRLDTVDGSRTVDLVPGVFPGGFDEVLRYTCSERCDVGHDAAGPKTLTACAAQWQPAWSSYVRWSDAVPNADGTLTFPGGWLIAGAFVFTYSGTRASDGGTDTLAKTYPATNWDAARDYAAFPPDRAARDGSSAGSFAPWDVRSEPAGAWFDDFGPFLAAGLRAPIAAERVRCDAVQQQGVAGGFYANG